MAIAITTPCKGGGNNVVPKVISNDKRPIVIADAQSSDRWLYFACKRCMDIILATALLILLSPLLLLIAILIKLDTPGPVIFVQERVGSERQWLGRTSLWVIRNFRMFKFRSMYQDADPAVHEAYIRDFVEGRARPSE